MMGRKIRVLIRTAAIGIFALWGLGLGCGGNDDNNNDQVPPDNGVELALLPSQLAPAICEYYDRCLGLFVALTPQQCRDSTARELANGNLGVLMEAAQNRRIQYDGLRAQGCVDALSRAGCDEPQPAEQECADVFRGVVLVDGECTLDEECRDTLNHYCHFELLQCPGVCTPRIALGGSCVVSGQCESGLDCIGGVCRQPRGLGEQCDDQNPCGGAILCAGRDPALAEQGQCRTLWQLTDGEPGDPCDAIRLELCREDLVCALTQVGDNQEATAWQCVAPSVPGDRCALSVPNPCPMDHYCGIETVPEGTCVQMPEEGESCSQLIPCRYPATCFDGLCVVQRVNGEPCSLDLECHSLNCADGVCALPNPCVP